MAVVVAGTTGFVACRTVMVARMAGVVARTEAVVAEKIV
jgi:hypothetical protein